MTPVRRSYREKTDIIRKKKHKGVLYYSIVDVVKALSDKEGDVSWYRICPRLTFVHKHIVKLDMPSFSLNPQPTDCLTKEWVFQVILSLKSDKAEAIKFQMANQFAKSFTTGDDLADFIINTK